MFITIIKLFIPEIIFLIYRKLFKTKKKKFLFDGHSKLFKDSISKETIYGEYGCGLSTCYVSKNFEIPPDRSLIPDFIQAKPFALYFFT